MKRVAHTAAAALLALTGLVSAQNVTVNIPNNVTCTTHGLHFIVVRGSLEDPGTGRIGWVAANASLQIPDSSIESVAYPATEVNYTFSVADGVSSLTQDLEAYDQSCPNGKIALLGYSQGAQAVMDTLCGTDETYFNSTDPIASSYTSNVIAIVLYGDPTFVPGESWDLGTSNHSGIFPRLDSSACEPYASKIQSYCDTGDIYCAAGSNTSVHGSYFGVYDTDAVDFIVSQWKAATSPSSSSSASSSATPTPSAGSNATVTIGSPTASVTGSGGSSGSGTTSGPGAMATAGASTHAGNVAAVAMVGLAMMFALAL